MKPLASAWITLALLALAAPPASAEPAVDNPSDGEAEALFNGMNFDGWTFYLKDDKARPEDVWTIRDGGVIHCTGAIPGYFRTLEPHEDYELTFEWRWTDKAGNSGLLLHCQPPDKVWPRSIEGQLMHGHAADFWLIGGTDCDQVERTEDNGLAALRVPRRGESNEKPAGEWNHYRAVCDDDHITLFINGRLKNEATGCSPTRGFIGFQSEGAPIQFRNIHMRRLRPPAPDPADLLPPDAPRED